MVSISRKLIYLKANPSLRIKLSSVLSCALLICVFSLDCAAQNPNLIPRVGTIKDYPATGLMTGCGNLYSYHASRAGTSAADYVFLARGDGSHAWMNLGGRDVTLRQLKSLTRDNHRGSHYEYRFRDLRISVVIERFRPENDPGEENDPMFKMKITLRKGSAVRIVRIVGDSDC